MLVMPPSPTALSAVKPQKRFAGGCVVSTQATPAVLSDVRVV